MDSIGQSLLNSPCTFSFPSVASTSLLPSQVLSCQGTWGCSGGLPSDALEYMANATVTSAALLPYTGNPDSTVCQVNERTCR